MSDDVKLCVDCKYYAPTLSGPFCMRKEAEQIDYVLGAHRQMGCDAMRINRCGPEGKLWEPKP